MTVTPITPGAPVDDTQARTDLQNATAVLATAINLCLRSTPDGDAVIDNHALATALVLALNAVVHQPNAPEGSDTRAAEGILMTPPGQELFDRARVIAYQEFSAALFADMQTEGSA